MANKFRVMLILLLSTLVASGMDARLVEKSSLAVVQQGYVRAVGGELAYFTMNLSIPSSTDYQTAMTDRPVTKVDADNSVVNIGSSNPGNPFNYKITSSVSLEARYTTYLPETYQLGYSQMLYTRPTARIQSNDAAIREMARNITANSSDDFERVSKLALWVNRQLTYDLSLAGESKDAEWILQNRRGVCSEYSTLFVALARSIGIPARIVEGLAYDDAKNEWTGHAWAEAYIGTWVPVDPTWNPPEVGYLDAMHLEFSKKFDNETFNNIEYSTSQNARLEWSQPDPSKSSDVTIVSFKEGEKNADYDLEGAASTIGMGMKTLVFVDISSDDYRLVHLNLVTCNVINVEDSEKYVILEPRKPQVVSWVLTPASGLSNRYEYTCPALIDSDYLSAKNLTIKITSGADTINFNGFVEKDKLQPGENQTVYVDVGVARTYSGNLYLTSDDAVYSRLITRSGRYSFSLQPSRIGLNRVYLATSLGGAKELDFQVTESTGIGVEMNAPQFVLLDSQSIIYVNLTSNETDKNVRITATAGAYKEAKQISLTGNKTVEFYLSFNDSYIQNITVTVESGGFIREVTEPVTVYSIPTISFTKKLSNSGNGSVRADLTFSGIQDARDVVVSIDGMQEPLSDGVVSVVLAPGMHNLRVDYTDMGGTKRFYTAGFDVTAQYTVINESSIEDYVSASASALPAVLYFGLLVILAVVVLILKKTEKIGEKPS
ncbi:transglutaminase domain-containing protein [Candidatus Micrarchaeota archaeon]|nr:transglutaminase domain-containing protein [Candidatus Micrarchaeota archaeon]